MKVFVEIIGPRNPRCERPEGSMFTIYREDSDGGIVWLHKSARVYRTVTDAENAALDLCKLNPEWEATLR